jgi:hypothetical protein
MVLVTAGDGLLEAGEPVDRRGEAARAQPAALSGSAAGGGNRCLDYRRPSVRRPGSAEAMG